jgi:hypothetical protein
MTPPTPHTLISPTPHTRVRRADRATYERSTIHAILDEALVCHLGFVEIADARPVVIPMLHVRVGDNLYFHGSPAGRIFRLLGRSPLVCATVTIVDGLVLARSAFHHSANYRSVVVMGRTEPVADLAARRSVLDALTDKLVPGRRPGLRPMTDKEVRGTAVVRLPIEEASAKIRSGPPIDDEDDYRLPIWAGVIPVTQVFGVPVPDPRQLADIDPPGRADAIPPTRPGFVGS